MLPPGKTNSREIPPTAESSPSCAASVVIAWVNPLELLRPTLDALHDQNGREPDEIIVVTRHGIEAQRQLQAEYPDVTLLAAPPGTSVPRLRSIGLERARGWAVAVTEDHCIPDRDWVATLERRLSSDLEVVGGPVENACTRRLRDWAAFLTEYAFAVAPVSTKATSQLPGNNVAYRRAHVSGLRATLDRGRWESFYHAELGARGVPMGLDAAMRVDHRRPFDFWYFVRQRYHFCRSFAAMRCQSFSAFDRVKYGLGSMLLPPLLLARGLRTLLLKGRFVGRYVGCLPLIGIYVGIGAIAEMTGYLLGGGHSLERVE